MTQSIGKNVRGLQWCNWRSIFYFFLSISFFLAFSKGIGMHQTSSEASQSWSHSGELRQSEGKGNMYNMTSYMNIYYIALCATRVLNPRDPEPRCQVWSAEVQSAGALRVSESIPTYPESLRWVVVSEMHCDVPGTRWGPRCSKMGCGGIPRCAVVSEMRGGIRDGRWQSTGSVVSEWSRNGCGVLTDFARGGSAVRRGGSEVRRGPWLANGAGTGAGTHLFCLGRLEVRQGGSGFDGVHG